MPRCVKTLRIRCSIFGPYARRLHTSSSTSSSCVIFISFYFYSRHLRYLDLSYNLIECIENLDNLCIQELYLKCNCITSFKSAVPGRGVNVLPDLRTIILAHNRLSTLQFFKVIESESYLKTCRLIELSYK